VFPLNNLDSPPNQDKGRFISLNHVMEVTTSYISYFR